jgi:membrane-associated phospholipid phosphatase
VDEGRAVVAGAVVALLSFLALAVGVTQGRLAPTDRQVRALVQQSRTPSVLAAMEAVSLVGGEPGQTAVVLLGSVVLWRRRAAWLLLLLPGIMAGSGVLQLAAKRALDRPRPNLDPWGFPSAHVLSLLVLCGCLAYVLGRTVAARRWRALGIGVCVAAIGAVAVSRLYLDAHWFSDVLGGLTLGLAYLLVVIRVLGSRPAAALGQRPLGAAGRAAGT